MYIIRVLAEKNHENNNIKLHLNVAMENIEDIEQLFYLEKNLIFLNFSYSFKYKKIEMSISSTMILL